MNAATEITIRANISGSNLDKIPAGWRIGAHWSDSRAGISGYWLLGPNDVSIRMIEGGARCPTVSGVVHKYNRHKIG